MPEAEWELVMSSALDFCHTTNIGDIFIPGSRFEIGIVSDHRPAASSLSRKVRIVSRFSSSEAKFSTKVFFSNFHLLSKGQKPSRRHS